MDNMLNADKLGTEFLDALRAAWAKDSAYPPCQTDYDDKHPSWGNCLVSSLAAWSVYGGDLIPGLTDTPSDNDLWHFRLRLNGNDQDIDLTWEQFDQGGDFKEVTAQDPEQYKLMLQGSFWDDDTLTERLGLLIDRIESAGYAMPETAANLVARLQNRYGFIFNADFGRKPAENQQFRP